MLGGFASNITAIFNLTTGAVGTTVGSPTTQAVNVGNGWWRFSITATATSTTATALQIRPAFDSTTAFYAGDGYSGIYIWGAQLEAGAFPTSYIPTVASQVTRSGDLAVMTGANFSSWYSQGEGAFYFESAFNAGTASILHSVSDNTFNNTYYTQPSLSSVTNRPALTIRKDNAAQTGPLTYSSTSTLTGIFYKMMYGYQTNDVTAVMSGGATSTDTTVLLPVVDRMYIGAGWAGGGQLNGTIKKIAYYPKRISNTNIVALTS
jgi:hypothetical protein